MCTMIDYENKTKKKLSFQFANDIQNQLIINGILWLGGINDKK